MTPVERLLSEFEMFASGHVPEIVVSRLPMLFDALRAEIRPGDPRVTTHHADCWDTRGHHACAIAKIQASIPVPTDDELAALFRAIGGNAEASHWHALGDWCGRINAWRAAPPTDGSGA